MRISQTTEWAVIGVLIVYIAFTPGFQVVRQFLRTDAGKALALAAIVAVWKYVSPLIAVLLTINFVRCASMREYMENPPEGETQVNMGLPPNTYCPENFTFDNGQCKNNNTGQSFPASVCLPGQTWDGTKCIGSSAAPTPPVIPAAAPAPEMTPPPSTSSTETKQPFTNLTPAMYAGVQPSMKESYGNFAPA